ncbi:unnamed protein product [Cochlearia groenlandica]
MGRNVEKILKRVSTVFITIGTAITVAIILQSPETCISPSRSNTHFPRSTCDSNAAKSSSSIDEERSDLGFLRKHMKTLGLSAGAGHAPMLISQIGVSDVTAATAVEFG